MPGVPKIIVILHTFGDTYQAGLEVMDELILHLQAEGKALPKPKLVFA